MDFTLYWFMFPVAMMVCTTAMLSGIGGAALFMPIFLLIFPLMGEQYVLADPVAAIAVALFTEAFGFSSGFIGYRRRGLIDKGLAVSFLYTAVPLGIVGAIVAHWIPDLLILLSYGLLMLVMALVFVFAHRTIQPATSRRPGDMRELTDAKGVLYRYPEYKALHGQTGVGGFLTGMLSAGIGEVVMPQLVKRGGVPIPVAAGTSILIVIITVFCASFAHIAALIQGGGMSAVPWNILCYSIPGVLIGGQIGSRLQGVIPQDVMEKAIPTVFALVGVGMMGAVWLKYSGYS